MRPTRSQPVLREPIRFERICLEKVWGGRRLAKTPGIPLPGDRPIGETWELADRADQNSVVATGSMRGTRLRELMETAGDSILGRARRAVDGTFPLLVKFLDANEPLSVQVHPPEGAARAGEQSKTEAWYFLHAEPGARMWLGLKPGVRATDLAATAGARDVLSHVLEWPVSAGEYAFVPGGTVHAIGAGITLLEVQENSDTTHRIYDWDRVGLDGKPRETHVEKALESTRYGETPPGPRRPRFVDIAPGVRRAKLVDCSAFELELFEIDGRHGFDTGAVALVHVVVAGHGRLTPEVEPRAAVELAPGDTWLAPASLGRHLIESDGAPLRIVTASTKA